MKRFTLAFVFGLILVGGCATRIVTPTVVAPMPVAKTASFHGRFHIEYAFTKVRGTSFADTT